MLYLKLIFFKNERKISYLSVRHTMRKHAVFDIAITKKSGTCSPPVSDGKTLPQCQFPYQRSLASHKQSTGAAYIHNSYRKSSALPAMLRANTS